MGGYAWVTLATNDSYSLGALVLAHSLKKSKTAHKSVVLITPAVSQPMREQLGTVFDVVKVVDVLDSKDEAHLALMQRPELGITFTKIHCWKLVEFDKCVFLDADTLVVRNCDELFEREEFSAAPDVSWPDCFNSGVFVYKPSVQTFNELLQFAVEKGSFDGGDQGLLNQFFSGWATEDIKKHLPFVYNLTSVAAYSYIPAFKHYGSETRIVHFIGAGKPWLQQLDPATRTITPTSGSEHLTPLLQQWWDLFCEKVHPGLEKNLESSNDGMSHPPVAACSNSLPIALTDDSQTPRLIEPCTPYREKDDFRQYNLPYQPFDVKGSSGELLNVEFLLASVHPTPPPEEDRDEQQRRQPQETEEKNALEERNENEENRDMKENESTREAESSENTMKEDSDSRTEEKNNEWKEAEAEEQKQEQEPEQPPPPVHPFDYDSFFPDETCINKYLEQNVITYQPYDNHQPQQQQHQNHRRDSTEDNSQHPHEESNTEIHNAVSDPRPSEDSPPLLPRFLTIPENDKRQSGNTETHLPSEHPEPRTDLPPPDPPIEPPHQPFAQEEAVEEKRELTKSKSMPYLRYDVTEVPPSASHWKSQPNVSVDLNRKFSMPKLKPILPRQNSLSRSVPSVAPKVTLYTEFLMSSDYKDPSDLPKDKVGFVEALIHRKGQLRRSKSAADIEDKFGPLPYTSPEIEQPPVRKKMPLLHLDAELYDLSQCRRQMGNKPKVKDADRGKENGHSLPALKPLVPPKDKKSTLIKKRKSKELSPGDGGREKILKKGPKMPKERKRECKTAPRNVSEAATGNDVNDILTRLREFSKNYQHFFGVTPPQPRNSAVTCRNSTVQADDLTGNEWNTSESFLKTSCPAATPVSRATQTPREEASGPRHESAVDSKFTHFRNYVAEKSRSSQKGLLGVQELVSEASGREDEVREGVRTSSDALDNWIESKRESERVSKSEVGGLTDGDSPEGGGSVEKEASGKGVSVGQGSSPKGDETHRGNLELNEAPVNASRVESNFEKTVKSASHSTCRKPKELEKNDSVISTGTSSSFPAEKSKPVVTAPPSHSEELIPDPSNIPVESDVKDAVLSPQEREQTNGLGRENKSCSPAAESNGGSELTKQERVTEENSASFTSEPGKNAARTEHESDGMPPNGRGFPETPQQTEKPVGPTPKRKLSKEKTLPKPRTKASADTSGSERVVKQSETEANGKLTTEMSEDGGSQPKGEKSQRRLAPGKKERTEEKAGRHKLKNSNGALPYPASKDVAVEVLEEVIAKATLQKAQTWQTPRKTPKPVPSRRKLPGHSPNDSPDGTRPPPPPTTPRRGNALPESQNDRRGSSGIAGAIAQLSLDAGGDQSSESAAKASTAHQEYVRRQNWETGNMDYMGRDSFDNIWSKICQTLEGKESAEAGPAAVSPKQPLESLAPSGTISTEGQTTPELPLGAETPKTSPLGQIPKSSSSIGETPKPSTPIGETSKPSSTGEPPKPPTPIAETPKPLIPIAETPKPSTPIAETPKPSTPIAETPKPPTPIAETPKPSTPIAETPKSPTPIAETPKPPTPIAETPKPSTPIAETPKPSSPIAETPKPSTPIAETPKPPTPIAETPKPSPAGETSSSPSAVLPTCPEYIETLSGDPAAGPVEDDEIIFSKPESRQSCLTNIAEVEEDGKDSSLGVGAQPVGAAMVKLSDILRPSAPEEKEKAHTAGDTMKQDKVVGPVETPAQKAAEKVGVEKKASADEKGEKPQQKPAGAVAQTELEKPDSSTQAAGQPAPQDGGTKTSGGPVKDEKPATDEKAETCTTVAIPSPPIAFPGAPLAEKDKKAQPKRQPEAPAADKFEPIPLPAPTTPTQAEEDAAGAKTSDSAKDQGKQKKGVFTKILEMVGVTPKEAKEDEVSKSVFYDVEGTAPVPPKDETAVKSESQGPAAATEAKEEVPPKQVDDAEKRPHDEGESTTDKMEPKETPATPSKDAQVSHSKPEETSKDTSEKPEKTPEQKPPIQKPARSVSPKEPAGPPKSSSQAAPKSKSPGPKLTLSKESPETATTTPTPAPQSDFPLMKSSDLLKVDDTILETPPVPPDPPKEAAQDSAKGKVLTEVEDIIGKAKTEVESRLQGAEGESSDLINTMKLMMGGEQTAQAQSPEVQMEELKVTSEEDRMRHKGEVVSSKLSDQILKAIPPPRRKAISESSASTSAIPKSPPSPEPKAAPGETKPKGQKPSSIPVPPPRSRGKPTQPAPPKGKGKK